MGLGFRFVAAGLVLGGLCCGTAHAAAPPAEQTERLLYVMQFGGLTVADVMITYTETPERYETGVKLRSRGLLALFRSFNADLAGEGAITTTGLEIAPQAYRRDWSTEALSSALEISYDQDRLASGQERIFNPVTGEAKRREDEPWNKRGPQLKPVPANLRAGALDPLAAFIGAREMVRAGAGPNSFRIPVFDGNRRYDVVGTTEAPREVTINSQTRRVIGVKARVEPIFGFDATLNDEVHEGDGRILFTADERLLPVQIMVGNTLGVGVMNLIADCRADPSACATFADDQAQAQASRN